MNSLTSSVHSLHQTLRRLRCGSGDINIAPQLAVILFLNQWLTTNETLIGEGFGIDLEQASGEPVPVSVVDRRLRHILKDRASLPDTLSSLSIVFGSTPPECFLMDRYLDMLSDTVDSLKHRT